MATFDLTAYFLLQGSAWTLSALEVTLESTSYSACAALLVLPAALHLSDACF